MAEIRNSRVSVVTKAGHEVFIPARPASSIPFCERCNQPIFKAEIKITRVWPRRIAKFLRGDTNG